MANPVYNEEQNGSLQFGSMSHAPMADGYYRVTATAEIHHNLITDWSQIGEFYVSGPRFVLPPADLYSVYPPDRSSGPYETTLSTLILSRAGLPWERFPEAGGTASTGRSWLALLLFTEAEMQGDTPITTEVVQLSDFVPPADLNDLDDVDSQVVVISIPTSVATTVMPSYDDLSYVAHLRRSVSANGQQEGAERAVLMCNRLPRYNERSYVFLVSLEGKYANGSFTYPTSGPLRLPVLTAWQFTNDVNAGSFYQVLQTMNMNPSTLRIPPSSVPLNPSPEPYWSKGFVALPHGLRNGQSTASWYHGPLAPCIPHIPLTFPAPSADALVIYDQVNGMFDEAYASAWTLGRLMALQNQQFALTLSQWKQQNAMAQRQSQQAQRNSHLPVVTTLDRWNQIMAAQKAFVRMNRISTQSVCSSIVPGGVTVTFGGGPTPLLSRNDTFGLSVAPVGSPYIGTVGNATSYMGGDFCLSLWLNKNVLGDSHNKITEVISIGRGSDAGWVSVQMEGENLTLMVGSHTQTANSLNLPDGWHNFALTVWTDSQASMHLDLHVDGEELLSQAIAPSEIAGTTINALVICNQANHAADSWASECANFRLFTDPLDADDIAMVMTDDTRMSVLHPFFNQLSLLHEVPFSYLIPTEAMLLPAPVSPVPVGGSVPDNAIRFFQVDPAWIDSLLDGAFSIGRNSQAQLERDAQSLQELGITSMPAMSGFVMRGTAVSGWKDLTADGYSQIYALGDVPSESTALRILRMERLSENTLLCIFEGNVKTVDLHVRKTALHSGVNSIESQSSGSVVTWSVIKQLRNLQGVMTNPAMLITEPLPDSKVLSLSSIAALMAQQLGQGSIDAGIFGMEMMEGTPIVRITTES
jgi:hypothetical protein